MPIGTPTAEEQQATYARQLRESELAWQEQFGTALLGCAEGPNPEACIDDVARTSYEHRDIDFEGLVATKPNNPLPEDTADFGMLTPIVFINRD
jgi:hypothetical protein